MLPANRRAKSRRRGTRPGEACRAINPSGPWERCFTRHAWSCNRYAVDQPVTIAPHVGQRLTDDGTFPGQPAHRRGLGMRREEGDMSLRLTRSRRTAVLAGAFSVVLAVSACSSGGDDGDSGGGSTADCAQFDSYGDLKGKTVTVYTGIVTPEDVLQKDSYKPFEECTGVTIKYEGDKAFETQILVRAKAGNPPDIAIVPQPGLLKQLVATGKVEGGPARGRRERRQVLEQGLEGLRHGRRQVLRRPARRQREVAGLVLAEASSRTTATRSRPRSTSSRPCPTRSPRTARSRGARASAAVRRPAGRSPTGWRT